MSNLLKSKFLLGVMIVAVMFAAVVVAVFATTALAADCSITSTLKLGSKGDQVKCLQAAVGVTADGSFGPKTKAAVVAWQTKAGLTADGIVGAKSRAALPGGSMAMTYPAGCTSTVGFSPTTGVACSTTPTVTYPAGCTSSVGFSPTTGASCATGVVTSTGTGPVAVSLATDNPASGSFIAPSSGVQFAKFTFTGSGTVTSVKLMRTGVSASTTLSNVYLYDGASRLTDGSSISSDNTVTFNAPGGLFTVAGSKTITVVADTLVADYSLGFTLVGYTANTVASVVSVAGNLMFGAAATLAIVTMSSATGSGDADPGLDLTVWQGTATVATRDVLLKSLALRQIGSINSSDINNFKLYADSVLVSTVANLDANKYVTFATSIALKTGARTLKVTADIIGGSSRTAQFSLRGSYDILATDTQYNANGTAAGTFPFGPAAFTLNAGSITVVKKTNSPSSNITRGASDQNLASYTFTAYGEPIKVETLRVGMITTGGTVTDHSLRNVRILVDGAQVGSNTTVPAAASFATNTGTQFTTNFIVYPGKPATVEIHSDIFDNEGTDDIATPGATALQALLVGGASVNNGVPQVSITAIDVPTSDNALGNTLTISAGTMALAQTSSYVSRSVAVPQTAYKVGSYQLTGNSTEAINLNTIYVGWTTGSSVSEATDLSDLYVVYGGTMTSVKGTVTGGAGAADSVNSNSWSVNRSLAKNETIQIDVYATLAASVSTNAIISTLAVAGTTADSGIATYADASVTTSLTTGFVGQTITGATGTLVMSQDASTGLAKIVDDSGTVKSLAAKIVATTDDYTITDFTTVTISNVTAVSTVTLKYAEAYNDGLVSHTAGEVIGAAKPAATSLTWSGLNLIVKAGTTLKVDVELAMAPVGVSAGTTGALLTTAITVITARNSAGTSAATGAGTVSGTATGNVMYVYKAIPTVTALALPTSVLLVGTNTLSKFSIGTGGTGTIGWKRIIFNITKTSIPTLANGAAFTVWNADSGTQIAGTATVRDSADAATCIATLTTCRLQFVPTTEQQITGTVNYLLKATVGGTLVATDYVSTTFSSLPSVFATSDDYTAVAAAGSFAETYAGYGTAASFIWSDVSGSGHDSASVTVTDWSNDYLVRLLPLDSQTLTK